MPLQNVKSIFSTGSILSSVKLLLAIGIDTRPRYKAIFRMLLQPFVHQGEMSFDYRLNGRIFHSKIRMSDLSADAQSTLEMCARDIYHLDRGFQPDVVVDGGGNIGLFTLFAAGTVTANHNRSVKFVVCEPLPKNVEQIRRHMSANGVDAEIMPYCLGGVRRTIPFYCREANKSSFEAEDPYERVIDIPVVTLEDTVKGSPAAERILIKLDIEGMEVEALRTFVPIEKRAVYVVGELHDVPVNRALIEEIFTREGWKVECFDVGEHNASFQACSPAAVPLLAWARQGSLVSS